MTVRWMTVSVSPLPPHPAANADSASTNAARPVDLLWLTLPPCFALQTNESCSAYGESHGFATPGVVQRSSDCPGTTLPTHAPRPHRLLRLAVRRLTRSVLSAEHSQGMLAELLPR